jgi:hypothetical protein
MSPCAALDGNVYAKCKVSDVGNASICQTPVRFSHHNFTFILIIQLTKHMGIPVNSPTIYIEKCNSCSYLHRVIDNYIKVNKV